MRPLNTTLVSFADNKGHVCQQAHVLPTRHWSGPNLWSSTPTLEAQLLDMPSSAWPALEQLLHALLLGVGLPILHCQCLPQANGRGTVVLPAAEPRLGRRMLHEAMDLLNLTEALRPAQWQPALNRILAVMDEDCLGPSTACIVEAATQRGLPHFRLFPKGNLVQLGMGAAQQRIWTAESDLTGAIGQDIAADKALTKRLLSNAGLPTPNGEIASSPAQAWMIAQRIGLPVVVKPLDGNRARGVTLNLHDQDSMEAAWHLAKSEGTQVMVERYIRGYEHRVLVVGGAVVAATRGEQLSVTGDGCHSVHDLVQTQINNHPRCLIDMTVERIDMARNTKVHMELQRQQLTAQSTPAEGQCVVLLRTGNLTVDCTDDVHPDIARCAILAARTIGLDIAGIDLVVQDIRQPLAAQGGAMIEVNAGPSLLMHLRPVHGQPRAVGEAIGRHLFPSELAGRIPLAGLLAPTESGARMAHALGAWMSASGYETPVAIGDALYLPHQPHTPAAAGMAPAAQRALMHRSATAAVISQNSLEAVAQGWAYLQCDVSIITPEPPAMDLSVQQRVIAAQLRAVRPGGAVVLPAGSVQLEALALTCLGRVIWVDADEAHPALQSHQRVQGGTVFVRQGQVICQREEQQYHLPLPATLQGWALHEWLCVVAAGWALELPWEALSQVQPRNHTLDA